MSVKRVWTGPVAVWLIVAGLVAVISVGGCPVAQQPTSPTTDGQDDVIEPPANNNQRDTNRPIPPPPLDEPDDGTGGGGSSGGGTDGGGSGGGGDGGSQAPPISVDISAPGTTDVETAPGGEAAVTYEVFGGDPADGAISIELLYDVDGLADSGDEVVLAADLAARGTQAFTTAGIASGAYRIGVRAFNSEERKTTYAAGRLVIVAPATLAIQAPTVDARVRPADSISVKATINSLAATVSYSVFTDTDGALNGNETESFAGGGKQIDGTVLTAGFAPGDYNLGVTIEDSVGQTVTEYIRDAGGDLIVLSVDAAPSIQVTAPATNVTVDPGQPVDVSVVAMDPEGNATVVIFYDVDTSINGNETLLAVESLTQTQQTFQTVMDTNLPSGLYFIGAYIDDGVGLATQHFGYAPGNVRVSGPPTLQIVFTQPTADVFRRPGATITLGFRVNDPDEQGKPNSIEIIAAYDANQDGVLDEAEQTPVWSAATNFEFGVANTYSFDTTVLAGLIDSAAGDPIDGVGQFWLGVRAKELSEKSKASFATNALVYLDNFEPQLVSFSPADDVVRDGIGTLTVTLETEDTSPRYVAVLLDNDTNPLTGDEEILLDEEVLAGGVQTSTVEIDLAQLKAERGAGFYYFYVLIFDNVMPITELYAPQSTAPASLRIRDRLIGTVRLSTLTNSDDGAILQGYNFNDLGGSSLARVPDLDDDGDDELLIGSRFGEPYLINQQGIGFGEAYLIMGRNGDNNRPDTPDTRLKGVKTLNAVGASGASGIPGVTLPGIRMPMNTTWSEGLADMAVVDDMDGDNLPEFVFGFSRVESLSLADPAPFQHPDLLAHPPGLGDLEFSVITETGGAWATGRAQFTRGGVVVVSSHNAILWNTDLFNRRFDRVVDLHEVGQTFTSMSRPSYVPFIASAYQDAPPSCADCFPDDSDENDPGCPSDELQCTEDGCDGSTGGDGNMYDHKETVAQHWTVRWDIALSDQGPGGFHQTWTEVAADPPLANYTVNSWTLQLINQTIYPHLLNEDCYLAPPTGCDIDFEWQPHGMCPLVPWPCMGSCPMEGWHVGSEGNPQGIWTGFYAPGTAPLDYTIGARILGQSVNDRFGSSVGSDGTFLYMTAPRHSALLDDVPQLPDPDGNERRDSSGVVYAYRMDSRSGPGARNRAALWLEPSRSWPFTDLELETLTDYTMPVPHQYIIETVGSHRNSAATEVDYSFDNGGCPPGYSATAGAVVENCGVASVRAPGTAGYDIDRVSQIVGPHDTARVEFVRGLGDVNADGQRDVAFGCPRAYEDFADSGTPRVGAVFVMFDRPTGVGGDVLLERVAAPDNPLRGVWVKGDGAPDFGSAFDAAGDFNGDFVPDVVIGSPRGGPSSEGEVVVMFGSSTDSLQSPPTGYTFDDLVTNGLAVRFVGEAVEDLAGATVTGVGDVDGDGIGDILISAPGAHDPDDAGKAPGVVYLIYGSPDYDDVDEFGAGREINLASIGTSELPGVKFVGRNDLDYLGAAQPGFEKTVNPPGTVANVAIYPRGVAGIGDIDGDGRSDYAIGAIQADPSGRQDAGEVYVIYGKGD